MKTAKHYILSGLLFCALTVQAAELPGLRYEDATRFRIINRGWETTSTPYSRMPAYMQDSCRQNQWWLYRHSSGIAVRFATDSRRIAAQYNLINNFHMQHMAMTGIKGTDLYCLNAQTDRWEYINTARPQEKDGKADSVQSKLYVENLDGAMHEYMLYLPLYDGVNWVQIGVDSSAVLTYPVAENPCRGKVVFYGTSILQGGCASRTGMVATSMIQRDLGVECVNLATSGEGKMDYYIARAMATIEDAVCFVVDPVPNCTEMMCDTLTYGFVSLLRRLRPEVPVVMVEGITYPYARYNRFFGEYLPKKNAAFRRNYERMKAENPQGLYYVPTDGLVGEDMEGTVDGIHLTDLGFRAYADIVGEYVAQALIEAHATQVLQQKAKPQNTAGKPKKPAR